MRFSKVNQSAIGRQQGRGYAAIVVLIALAGVSVYVTEHWQQLIATAVPRPPITIPMGSAAPSTLNAFSVKPVPALKDLSVTRTRPLFSATRKPFVPPLPPTTVAVPKTTAAPAKRYAFALSAVIITDTVPLALVLNPATGATERLRVGDTILGWAVAEIAADSMTLTQSEERETIALRNFDAQPKPQTRATPSIISNTTAQVDTINKRIRRPRRQLQGPRRQVQGPRRQLQGPRRLQRTR